MIGGVRSGLHGETNIKGLYVAGEVASTGIHGANRLASNSLLECLVFSQRAVEHSKETTIGEHKKTEIESNFKIDQSKATQFVETKNKIQQLMFEHVGIIRNKDELLKGEMELDRIKANFPFEENEYYSFQLKAILSLAHLMITSALQREESRGAQKRSDFTETNDDLLFEIVQQKKNALKFININ
jgi:L-aspartate oxidase